MIYKWQFLSRLCTDKWSVKSTSALLDENWTCKFKRKKFFLSNMYENWAVSFHCEKQSLCWRFLSRLVGSFVFLCSTAEFQNLFFQLGFCHAVVISYGIFHCRQAQVFVFLLAAFVYIFLSYSLREN